MTETKSPPEPEVKTEVPSKPVTTNQKFMSGSVIDPSPVKTSVEARTRPWRPKTVAEHNAYVDRLSREQSTA